MFYITLHYITLHYIILANLVRWYGKKRRLWQSKLVREYITAHYSTTYKLRDNMFVTGS